MFGELEKEVASRKELAAELMREVLREAFEDGDKSAARTVESGVKGSKASTLRKKEASRA